MKNFSDTTENRTRDPPACSAVPPKLPVLLTLLAGCVCGNVLLWTGEDLCSGL